MSKNHLHIVDELLRQDLLQERKHHPLEEQRLQMARRLRLIPVAHGISTEAELKKAKMEFAVMETYFTQWRRDLVSASQSSDQRSPIDGLNAGMRTARTSYAEAGGLSALHSEEQMDFALSHGILMKIALEIRDGVQVTVGGVLMLTRSSHYTSPEAEGRDFDQQHLFPLYDLDQTMMPRDSAPSHENTAVTLRSVLLPNIKQARELGLIDSPDISEELSIHDLRHLGLPAAAKGALVEALIRLQEQGVSQTTSLRSHIGEIAHTGRLDKGIGNKLGRGFNDWMKTVGHVLDSFELDSASKLRLFFRILMADITEARTALLGPDGIASGKGHAVDNIRNIGHKTATDLLVAIQQGKHVEI